MIPTIRRPMNNYTLVYINDQTFAFSYLTCIGVQANGALYTRENVWGPTTGKHLNDWDGGSAAAKRNRLSAEDFQIALDLVAHPLRDVDGLLIEPDSDPLS